MPKKMTMAAMLAAAALTACATPTPYQPLEGAASRQGGYENIRIADNRYRVSFTGNSMTSRETVETYLLYRAAELTREQGYDWFEAVYRDTENKGRIVVDRPFDDGLYGWWGPSWSYYGRGFGRRYWHPWDGNRFFGDTVDVRQIDRYEATAEIVMHRGSAPRDNARAMAADEILENLGPSIVGPA